MVLVLALFFAPVGPGVPAGVLLARHVPLTPAATFGLYALSDAIAAIVCHPLFALLRRHGRNVKPIRWLGRRLMSLAMIGVRVPEQAGVAPALSRIAMVRGWVAAITGDLLWFAVLLGTSLVAASIADDDRFIALVMIVAMIVIPWLARRFVPALRPDAQRGTTP